MEVGPWLGAGAGAAAFPASAQAQMVVQRELVAVGRLPRCRSAPSPFLELPPFFVGSWIEAAGCQQGNVRMPKQCRLVPGSSLARSGEEAGEWWNGGVLGQLSGMVDWKLTGGGASVGYGGSHVPPIDYAFGRGNPPEGIVEVPLLPRQGTLGENLVQLWTDDDGVFWRHNPCEGVVLESSCRSGVVGLVVIGLA
uniref:Uncharacterized protein n=1 Tax=Oryza rufipogon TaxID=4529 RepID=A0A0E0MYX3_ORYRU